MRRNAKCLLSQHGFTIIEIVLVIILVGILSAAVFPKFSAVSDISLNTVMDQLRSDLGYAQELAMSTHTNCGIFINNTGTYTIYKDGDTATPAMNPATFSSYVITLPAGVTIATTANGNKIEFDNFGVPYDGNGAITVVRTFTLNGTLNLMVTPETGRVHQ